MDSNEIREALVAQAQRKIDEIQAEIRQPHPSYRVSQKSIKQEWDFLRGLLWAIAVIDNPSGPSLQPKLDEFDIRGLQSQVQHYRR